MNYLFLGIGVFMIGIGTLGWLGWDLIRIIRGEVGEDE